MNVAHLAPSERDEALAAEFSAAWRGGDRVPVEQFLAHHPELHDSTSETVRLIYEEVCLRQEFGESVRLDELTSRFPNLVKPLTVLLDFHQLVRTYAEPHFPEAAETLGEFQLVAELGRGAQSRVFLAKQTG